MRKLVRHFRLCAFLLALNATCGPNREAFKERVFFCDARDNRSGCGTAEDGAALTCFGGKQLGAGRDFCVEACPTDRAAAVDADSVCLSKAKLRTCRPSDRTPDDPDGCGKDLACLRTDLTGDEGVCLALKVCATDMDCTDSALTTCAATVLRELFPAAPYERTNLQCVVTGCKARQTSCPLGESCLPMLVPSTTPVPDLCVPACDSDLDCPPNYACWRRLSGPGSPNVCIPTLPGARCTTSLDCWAGECLDTGEGFSLCAVPCASDRDCVPFSDSSRRQYCAPTGNGRRHCIGVSPFGGALCAVDDVCPAGQKCFFTSPYWRDRTPLGECRVPCGDGDRCSARGGLAHACFVRDGDRSCYPGVLGVTCQQSQDCLAGRVCESLPPDDAPAAIEAVARGTNPARVCTLACTTDGDCLDAWNNREGYCAAGWCRLAHNIGSPCSRNEHCSSQNCRGATAGAPGTCAVAPAAGQSQRR
jgi:hypothetical protein